MKDESFLHLFDEKIVLMFQKTEINEKRPHFKKILHACRQLKNTYLIKRAFHVTKYLQGTCTLKFYIFHCSSVQTVLAVWIRLKDPNFLSSTRATTSTLSCRPSLYVPHSIPSCRLKNDIHVLNSLRDTKQYGKTFQNGPFRVSSSVFSCD